MQNIKFIKEPGYIFDLFFLFTLYFNEEYCLKNFINTNKEAEDRAYFEELLSDFGDVSDELRVFFELQDNKKNFMSTYYYEPYAEEFVLAAYDINKVQEALSNYKSVIENVIKCYFRDVDKNMFQEEFSLAVISRLIQESKYSGDMKSSLYAFFIEPISVIQKLSYEIEQKEKWLEQQYDSKRDSVKLLIQEFDACILAEKLKQCQLLPVDIDDFKQVFVSFSLHHKNLIKTHFVDCGVFLQLGYDYMDRIEELITHKKMPELEAFGNVISEGNRIDILNLIYRRKEITIKEVEQELSFTGANSYYHLSLMVKIGILKSRNKGRTILYSINESYFDDLCNILSKYSGH